MSAAGVLDTWVFIANVTGGPLDASAMPEEVATTVITLAELTAGVLAAGSTEVRARRLATLDAIADVVALPVDGDAARVWARLRAHLAEAGRRMGINDLWIAPGVDFPRRDSVAAGHFTGWGCRRRERRSVPGSARGLPEPAVAAPRSGQARNPARHRGRAGSPSCAAAVA